jgi:hypothetical protein
MVELVLVLVTSNSYLRYEYEYEVRGPTRIVPMSSTRSESSDGNPWKFTCAGLIGRPREIRHNVESGFEFRQNRARAIAPALLLLPLTGP